MLTCKNISENVEDYLSKDLGFFKRMSVQMHILLCHHCRRYMRQMKLVFNAVNYLPAQTALSEKQVDNIVGQIDPHKDTP